MPDTMLSSDVDLIIAIRANDASGVAKALEDGAATHDTDARELLLFCLIGADHATEIVAHRKKGGRHTPLRPIAVLPQWFSDGVPDDIRRALVEALRSTRLVVREKVQKGKPGKRSSIITKPIADGASVENRAIRWAVRVHGMQAEEIRLGLKPLPRGAAMAAVRVSATVSLKTDEKAQRENRDDVLDYYRKALRAWRNLVRR